MVNEGGNDGVMVLDGSDDEDEDDFTRDFTRVADHADTLAKDGDLIHYENLQFLDKSNLEQLRDFGWLK